MIRSLVTSLLYLPLSSALECGLHRRLSEFVFFGFAFSSILSDFVDQHTQIIRDLFSSGF